MCFCHHFSNGLKIAEIISSNLVIKNTSDFLDVIANAETDTIILKKETLDEAFFDLKTGFAGEILQKAQNYQVRLGVVGDFSGYKSESLRAFIRESNRVNRMIFVPTVDEAITRFSK